MSSGEVLCQTVELPPLSSEVASMLIVFKMDKNRKSDLEKMKDTRKELAGLYDEYQHKANESTGGRDVKETGTKRIMRSSPSTLDLASKSVQPQVHFIQTKYTRVCRKLNMTRRQVCGECSIEVSVLMLMFDNLMKEDFGAKLNMSKYKTHLAEQLKSPKITRLIFKREALKAKLSEDGRWGRVKPTSLSILRKILKAACERASIEDMLVQADAEFENALFSYTFGDTKDRLHAAVIALAGIPTAQPTANPHTSVILRKSTKPDYGPFNDLLRLYVVRFEARTEKAISILKSALLSIVFDMITPNDTILSKSSRGLLKKAEMLRQMSPRDLKMPEWFSDPDDFDLPLASLREKDEQLDALARECCSLCFLTSPIDIARSVLRLSYKIGNRRKESAGMLDFDELIICMIGIVALDPPPNAYGISEWLQKYITSAVSPQLSQAANLFMASVEFIRDFDPNSL